RRHTRSTRDWSSDVCSSDLNNPAAQSFLLLHLRATRLEPSLRDHPTPCTISNQGIRRPHVQHCPSHQPRRVEGRDTRSCARFLYGPYAEAFEDRKFHNCHFQRQNMVLGRLTDPTSPRILFM